MDGFIDGRPVARLRMEARDYGIVLRSGMDWFDTMGARDVALHDHEGVYYLHYDGASEKGWRACLAVSRDMVSWEKRGPIFEFGEPGEEDSAYAGYGPVIFDGEKWHIWYVAAYNTSGSPEQIPAVPYLTMKACADSPAGPWVKQPEVVPYRPIPGTWCEDTANAGDILKTDGEYRMLVSGACWTKEKTLLRTLGYARTTDLNGAWQLDKEPILPETEQIENAAVYYEPMNKTWFLFTNHVAIKPANEVEIAGLPEDLEFAEYTDAIWVYWTQNLDYWNPDNKAVVLDGKNCSWANECIGFAAVKPVGDRLVVLYDAAPGDSCEHMNRHIGLAWLDLPLQPLE